MSEERITPFLFEGESIVRTILRHGAPWFVSADACRAIGIANASQAVDALDDDEKGICSIDTPGGAQEQTKTGRVFAQMRTARGVVVWRRA